MMTSGSQSTKEFYSLQEVATKLGMSRMTIYRYVKEKKLPAYQFGRDFRVKADDLDNFLTEFKV